MTPTTSAQDSAGDMPVAGTEPGVVAVANFDRIGRRHEVDPLEVQGDADQIAEQVYRYARRFLGSREVEVICDLDEMRGAIYVGGCRNVGGFELVPNAR